MSTWRELPPEVRVHVSRFLPLGDLHALQSAAPDAALSAAFAFRVRALRALFEAWVRAPAPRLPSYRNCARYRQRAARAAASPVAFSRVRRLALGSCALSRLHGVSELRDLALLDVSDNALPELPVELARCARLRVLNAGGNRLSAFPRAVLQLPQLHTLLLHDNNIERLPPDWAGLPAIRRLGLYNCALRGQVPDALCRVLVRGAADARDFRTANLSQNAFSEDEIRALFQKYPLLSSRVAI